MVVKAYVHQLCSVQPGSNFSVSADALEVHPNFEVPLARGHGLSEKVAVPVVRTMQNVTVTKQTDKPEHRLETMEQSVRDDNHETARHENARAARKTTAKENDEGQRSEG